MHSRDIRSEKNHRRNQIKEMRRALDPQEKAQLDARVCWNVLKLYQYQRARTVLLYMSTPIEVDTRLLLEQALKDGKRVALPRCIPGTREMQFYYIRSLEDLEKGAFSLMEPRTDCEPFLKPEASICIVPALAYDRAGYRLGYGGGYYDRFLSGYPGPRIGIIYSANLFRALPHGRFDKPVSLVVSDRGFFYTKQNNTKQNNAKQNSAKQHPAQKQGGRHTPHKNGKGPARMGQPPQNPSRSGSFSKKTKPQG